MRSPFLTRASARGIFYNAQTLRFGILKRMKTKRLLPLLAALMVWCALPAFGVSKEIIQLQTQVQALQDQMARMQQSFDVCRTDRRLWSIGPRRR